MSLVARPARNHPQQVARRGANPAVDDRATSPEVFRPLMDRFDFTVDVAASSANAKCERFFSTEDDGLAQSWAGERVWCNPPYSSIEPWVAKAWDQWENKTVAPELIVMLVPANRTEQGWWQRWIEPSLRARHPNFRVEFLQGRLRFLAPGAASIQPNERPPFGCCLLIWQRLSERPSETG